MGCLRFCTIGVAVLAVFIGTFFTVLSNYPEIRHRYFASLCNCMKHGHSAEMVKLRCELLVNASGRVLEIGPGPGTSLSCLVGNDITEYVAVEPNTHMHHHLREEAERLGLRPPTILSAAAEGISVDDKSVDSVISTHVLCSVTDLMQVLQEVKRILKPGGRFFFFEHIASEPGTFERTIQESIRPVWKVLGDGCDFKDTWRQINELNADFDVSYEKFDAPIALTFVKPHMKGVAVRKVSL